MSIKVKLFIPAVVLTLVFSLALLLLYQAGVKATRDLGDEVTAAAQTTNDVYQEAVFSLMQFVKSASQDAMLMLEPRTLNEILHRLRQYRAVESTFFLDENELVLADGANPDENPLMGTPLSPDYQWIENTNEPFFGIIGQRLIFSAPYVDQGRPLGRLLVSFSLDNIQQIETRLISKVSQSASDSRRFIIKVAGGGLVIILIMLAINLAGINRALRPIDMINEDLADTAEAVNMAAKKILRTSRHISKGAQDQAASLEESASSLEELNAMSRMNLRNAERVRNFSDEGHQTAEHAQISLDDLNRFMSEISEITKKTLDYLKNIDEIAFQTSLLSLNASVEAARAGESGAGFSVVANAVKSLAKRSAEAAEHSGELIREIAGKVSQSVSMVGQTRSAFQAVTDKANQIKNHMNEIATASEEQASGISLISEAIAKMEQIMLQEIEVTEESANISRVMSFQSEQLSSFVRLLTGLSEKRKHMRIPLRIKGKMISGAGREIVPFETRDVSPSGMLVGAPTRLNIGSEWTVRFQNDEWGLSGVTLKILENRGETDNGLHLYGAFFLNQKEASQLELAKRLYHSSGNEGEK
jgi:methyl-accepting chemotaxis protein